jgi:glucose-6-phosphate isomerase
MTALSHEIEFGRVQLDWEAIEANGQSYSQLLLATEWKEIAEFIGSPAKQHRPKKNGDGLVSRIMALIDTALDTRGLDSITCTEAAFYINDSYEVSFGVPGGRSIAVVYLRDCNVQKLTMALFELGMAPRYLEVHYIQAVEFEGKSLATQVAHKLKENCDRADLTL